MFSYKNLIIKFNYEIYYLKNLIIKFIIFIIRVSDKVSNSVRNCLKNQIEWIVILQ